MAVGIPIEGSHDALHTVLISIALFFVFFFLQKHRLASMVAWRKGCKSQGYLSKTVYDVPGLQWTQTAFVQPQMHPYDRYFYNETQGKYTVGRYLQDLTDRYGGVDTILMWPSYPLLGIDDRSSYDMVAAMPGGVEGVRDLINELHNNNVTVLW